MNVYLTEEEQVEQIKRWWKKYGTSIVIGVMLGLALMYGWQYWQNRQVVYNEQASAIYEQLIGSLQAQDEQQAEAYAQEITKSFSDTPYAQLASLQQAEDAVKQDDYLLAEEKLQWSYHHGASAVFRQIAKIRAANVYVAMDQPEQALKILSEVDVAAYKPRVEELRGDIFLQMGEQEKARMAYQTALQTSDEWTAMRPMLALKLNQLQPSVQQSGETV